MKTRCKFCMQWIMWSRERGQWYHLDDGRAHCQNSQASFATRDPALPLVDLIESDRSKVQP